MPMQPLAHPPIEPPSQEVYQLLRDHAAVKLHEGRRMLFRMCTPPELAPEAAEAMCWISRVTGTPIRRDPPTTEAQRVFDEDDGWISLDDFLRRRRRAGQP